MFQKPIQRSNPNQKSNLRLFIRASSAMGSQGKQLVSSLNKPGQASRKPTSGRPSLSFQKDASKLHFPAVSTPAARLQSRESGRWGQKAGEADG